MADYEVCKECGEPFRVTEHSLSMPGTKEREPVDCPSCGANFANWTSNGWWNTYKLSESERTEWEAERNTKGDD